jgi:hypothetical protein
MVVRDKLITILRIIFNTTWETIDDISSHYFTRLKQKNLETLRSQWLLIQRGTMVVAKVPFSLAKASSPSFVDLGGGSGRWGPVEQFILQPGHGAMLLGITWPQKEPQSDIEEPVVFEFWCNNGIYKWKFWLSNRGDCTLPFRVLE